MAHFSNPHTVGEIKDADGVGEVGNPKCGLEKCSITFALYAISFHFLSYIRTGLF